MRANATNIVRLLGMVGVAGCLSSMASAQTPTFRLEDKMVQPGQTAELGLFVSGGVANTAALNVTINVTEGADKLGGNITGVKSAALAAYTFAENRPTATQYRAVIYAPSSGVTPFSSTSEIQVATISVPVAANATDGMIHLDIQNAFDADGVTGLTGLSDASGVSIHGTETPGPSAARGITVDNSMVMVEAVTGTTIDFCPLNVLPAEWEFAQVIPFTTPVRLSSASVPGQGFSVTLQAKDTFGFLQTKDTDATVIPSPGDGQLLHVLWTIGSNSASAYDLPTFRLRASARDASFTQEHIFQEGSAANNAPVVMPVTGDGAPRNFESVFYCPASLTNNNPNVTSNGIILAYDILQFGAAGTNGNTGSRLDLKKIVYSSIDPAGLGAGTSLINLDFSAGDSHNFTPIDFKPSGSVPGIFPSDLTSASGLSIAPTTAPVIPTTTGAASGVDFSFGIWEKLFDDASGEPWEVAADTLYKVQFTLGSTAPVGNPSHTARLRFTVGDNDFTGTAVINPIQDQSFDPRGSGTTYTGYLKFPPTTVGLPVKVSYDVYWVAANTRGTITLKSLTVTALENMSAAQLGSACP
jgi:hypothetical protein